MQKTVITKIIKDNLWISIDHRDVPAFIKGQIRLNEFKPSVGDYVEYNQIDNQKYIINKILERKNFLIRPRVANVDVVALVHSTKTPNFDPYLIDKMIAFYEQFNVEIILILTKSDLYCNEEIISYLNDYKKSGYEVFDINNHEDFLKMLNYFSEKIVCFVGNSGVGKSSLINRIDPNLNIRTQDVSYSLNRGKHTTTTTTLIYTKGFYLVDTPGYSTIDLKYAKTDLAHIFFHKLLKQEYCKFNDCLHLENSNMCLIKKLLSDGNLVQWRYKNYLNLLDTLGDSNDRYKNKKHK